MNESCVMLERQSILCISSVDWDFMWQSHQEIMASLAEHGNVILFIDNTGIRSPRLRDLPRFRQRLRNWWRGTKGFRQERENLFVYSPLILPFPYGRLSRRINRGMLSRALQRWMRASGLERPIVWTFLPTPLVVDLADDLAPKLVVYYCVADFEQLADRSAKASKSERQLLARADVVFVQGETLLDRCTPHPNVHVIPLGVNLGLFRPDTSPAPELRSLKRPIVGYVGGVHRHVDLDLVEEVAARTKGSVVLVGPVQTDVTRLRRLDNVIFIGPQPHGRVAEFIRGFDVGLIPYVISEYTRTVYPSKLGEYLAMGVPVVATDLPEIQHFNARYGDVITIAKDTAGFVSAIEAAVDEHSPAAVARRIEVARANSWETRIAEMSAAIEKTLEARAAAPVDWEERLRRLYRRARRRIARTTAGMAAVYLLLFHTPFVWLLAEPLRVSAPPRAADAIVVFAGGVGESGKAGGGYQERVKQAVDLYSTGKARWLIFSSGYVFAFREADIMKALAVAHGVPASAIILEMNAANTYENVVFVRDILHTHGWREILLVSSPYHMRRAVLTWRTVAPEIAVIPTPVPSSQFYSHAWGARLEQIQGILHEYLAIVAYWWRGWL